MDKERSKKLYLLLLIISFAVFFKVSSKIKHSKVSIQSRIFETQKNSKNSCLNKVFDQEITNNINLNTKIKNNTPETWINIFVHGIISLTPVLSLHTMSHVNKDNISNTLYEEYVKHIRQNSFFTKHEPKQELGLKPINQEKIDSNSSCSAIAQLFDLQFHESKNYYYTYGWSGFMSNKIRYNDARRFYKELAQEIKIFNSKNIYPKIRLIGFSHGGSECLEIADVIKEEKLPLLFTIDELILLGTPILEHTRMLSCEPVFKKIYNFYSGSDRVQILDFSQPNKHFSRRKFKSNKNFKLNDNLLQIKLEILRTVKRKNGCYFDPKEWIKSPARHSSMTRKDSPGHCEWWFLQYTNNFYRECYLLEPLPIVAFIPTILKNLNNTEFKTNKTETFGNHINLQLRPLENSMIIHTDKSKTKAKFLSTQELSKFRETVKKFNFKKTTKAEYNQEVKKELHKAHLKVLKNKNACPSCKKMSSIRLKKDYPECENEKLNCAN